MVAAEGRTRLGRYVLAHRRIVCRRHERQLISHPRELGGVPARRLATDRGFRFDGVGGRGAAILPVERGWCWRFRVSVLGDEQVRSRGLYRGLVEQSPAASYVDRLDGVSVYVSPQLERVTGISAERWSGGYDEWLSAVHPDDRDWVWAATQEFLVSGSPEGGEYRIVWPDGERVDGPDRGSCTRPVRRPDAV
jgi:PAS domain S-box-containing protein